MWEYRTNTASSAESSATGRVLHKHCCTFFSWKSVTLCSVPRVLSNGSGSYVARSVCVCVCPPSLHVNADKTGRLVVQLGSVFSKNLHPVELAAANIVIGKQGLSPFFFCYLVKYVCRLPLKHSLLIKLTNLVYLLHVMEDRPAASGPKCFRKDVCMKSGQ